jgi:glycosyltransferase involved in cell wall biosynthesis
MRLERIVFIHDGKANYPSIAANRVLFAPYFEVIEATFEEAMADPQMGRSLAWHMMGFYRKRLPAALTVHDYKSLSLGRFSRVKDWVKRFGNAVPDVRILKEAMLKVYGFGNSVPYVLQDIGVNDDLRLHLKPQTAKEYAFCYVGAMTYERKFDAVLRAFLDSPEKDKRFVLVGEAEARLKAEFAAYPNLIFTGRVAQAEVYRYVQASEVSVCYFPTHYPHSIQTPTKLLEAAALGARILINDQPMNKALAAKYGMAVVVGKAENMFAKLPILAAWLDNRGLDSTPLYWSHMVKESGIAAVLDKAAADKGHSLPVGFVQDYA